MGWQSSLGNFWQRGKEFIGKAVGKAKDWVQGQGGVGAVIDKAIDVGGKAIGGINKVNAALKGASDVPIVGGAVKEILKSDAYNKADAAFTKVTALNDHIQKRREIAA